MIDHSQLMADVKCEKQYLAKGKSKKLKALGCKRYALGTRIFKKRTYCFLGFFLSIKDPVMVKSAAILISRNPRY